MPFQAAIPAVAGPDDVGDAFAQIGALAAVKDHGQPHLVGVDLVVVHHLRLRGERLDLDCKFREREMSTRD